MVRKLREGNSLSLLLSKSSFIFLRVGVVPVSTFFCMDVGSIMYMHVLRRPEVDVCNHPLAPFHLIH